MQGNWRRCNRLDREPGLFGVSVYDPIHTVKHERGGAGHGIR
jgi:hypothetical protein